MKREDISKAVSDISTKYILEAETYIQIKKKKIFYSKPFAAAAIAASLVFCILTLGLGTLLSNNQHNCDNSDKMVITAYAYETNEDIISSGAVINTGTISDSGEMKGHPLMFYLSGKKIKSVRFSCKNQQIQFRDWKEKRDEFGIASNFTVPYGENEDEYNYLTVNWEPNETIQKLTDNGNITIKTLPDNLKEDLIVMEITFADGKTAVKAITISLLDNGSFFAKFDDYNISSSDSFVKREDAKTLRELSQIQINENKNNATPISSTSPKSTVHTKNKAKSAARKIALKYYSNTVFEVISMKTAKYSKNKIVFSVCVRKDGVIQEPNRKITLKQKNGKWKVTGEGY